MKRFLLFSGCLIACVQLFAQFGPLVNGHYPTSELIPESSVPDSCGQEFVLSTEQQTFPYGLAVEGKFVWVSGSPELGFDGIRTIVRHNVDEGTFTEIFSIELTAAYLSGMHLQEDTLWVVNEEDSLLYQINAWTGELYEEFEVPNVSNNIWGITGDGTHLYISEYRVFNELTWIYKMDGVTKEIVDTILVPANRGILGITYANERIYGIGPFDVDSLLVINPATGVVEEVLPWCIGTPYGIAYEPIENAFYGVSAGVGVGDTSVYRLPGIGPSSSSEIERVTKPLVSLYPNPAQDQLNISLSAFGNYQYQILSPTGQKILEGKFTGNHKPLFIENLETGLYFLQLNSEEASVTRAFIKR